jgi:hypothetical protein
VWAGALLSPFFWLMQLPQTAVEALLGTRIGAEQQAAHHAALAAHVPSYLVDRDVSVTLSRAVAVVAAEWPTLLPRAMFATWSAVFRRIRDTLGFGAADGDGGDTGDGGDGARSSSDRDWYANVAEFDELIARAATMQDDEVTPSARVGVPRAPVPASPTAFRPD